MRVSAPLAQFLLSNKTRDGSQTITGRASQRRSYSPRGGSNSCLSASLQGELGRVPKEEEINQVFLLTRVMYKAVLGLHFKRREQKKQGQLAIF